MTEATKLWCLAAEKGAPEAELKLKEFFDEQ